MDHFINVIHNLALTTEKERMLKRTFIRENINGILFNKQDYEDNRQLYLQLISGGENI